MEATLSALYAVENLHEAGEVLLATGKFGRERKEIDSFVEQARMDGESDLVVQAIVEE